MKNIASIIFLIINSIAFGQNTTSIDLKELYSQDQFEEIISKYAKEENTYDAEDLYYLAMCYYMRQDDTNCLKYMNQSIAKDNTNPNIGYFIEPYGYNLTFNKRPHFNQAAEYWWHSLSIVD